MFSLSDKSKKRLIGVNPALVKIVSEAIEISEIDFSVGEGLRSPERQKELVDTGASKTLQSKHLTGEAVDLFAYVDKKISWHERYYYPIAQAMREVAIKHGVILRWGAVWDKSLNELVNLKKEVTDYVARKKDKNEEVFLDFVHFELRSKK